MNNKLNHSMLNTIPSRDKADVLPTNYRNFGKRSLQPVSVSNKKATCLEKVIDYSSSYRCQNPHNIADLTTDLYNTETEPLDLSLKGKRSNFSENCVFQEADAALDLTAKSTKFNQMQENLEVQDNKTATFFLRSLGLQQIKSPDSMDGDIESRYFEIEQLAED